ncbi:hypothetical protein ACFRDV_17370 [Streptomyces fagopyri]|uniref:hypothetical protein n=1 Tax=Streptomyces fagopyri TaxID=2662397 RepID=UPI0036995B22
MRGRKRARALRVGAGCLMMVLAFGLAFNVTDAVQRALPDYTSAAQKKFEDSDTSAACPTSRPGNGPTRPRDWR